MHFFLYKVEACRARLYSIGGVHSAEEPPAPTTEWRKSCSKVILPPVSIHTLREMHTNHYRMSENFHGTNVDSRIFGVISLFVVKKSLV